jgi:NAD(P)-dependent dehydrogenase (short-subunit alcohol dehydrogenase family)
MNRVFSGQVALVAGGTGALGRALSLAFLREGATVTVTFRRQEEFDSLRLMAAAHAAQLDGHQLDVTDDGAVRQLIATLLARQRRLDILVNAVGGYEAGKTLWETEPKTFERMMSLNLYPGYILARAVAPAMLRQGRGAIVNVAAATALDPPAAAAAYAASKAAALAMIASLAKDLKGTGVRANSILPGTIDTEANREAMPDSDVSKWTKPEDIARVVLFLCGDAAKAIHGATIRV